MSFYLGEREAEVAYQRMSFLTPERRPVSKCDQTQSLFSTAPPWHGSRKRDYGQTVPCGSRRRSTEVALVYIHLRA